MNPLLFDGSSFVCDAVGVFACFAGIRDSAIADASEKKNQQRRRHQKPPITACSLDAPSCRRKTVAGGTRDIHRLL
jgi:hypothetical protein